MTASFPDLTRTEIDSKTDTDAGSLESEGTSDLLRVSERSGL